MKILLDHCIDRRLSRSLGAHEVKTANDMGWQKLPNGKLLSAAAGRFDVVLTVDQGMKHQQNLQTLPVAVLMMIVRSNKLADLPMLAPAVTEALKTLKPCHLVEVS